MFAAITLAAAVSMPPDGTYTYELQQPGANVTSDVSIAHDGDRIVVRERASAGGMVYLTWRTFDASLDETAYRVQAHDLDLDVALTPKLAAMHYLGSQTNFALPGDRPALVIDGLLAPSAILPAMLAAHNAPAFSILTTRSPAVIDVSVDRDARPQRPEGVPAGDVALTIVLRGSPQTMWYDPHTKIVDEFDPAPGVRSRLVSHAVAVDTFTPAPTPTPLMGSYPSREVTFPSRDGSSLAGTLSYPDAKTGRLAAIVLVAGSGTHDRNETLGALHPLFDLAQGLNGAGYAVLRYDKRFAGGSTSAIAADKVTRQSYVDDVLAAVRALRADSRVDPNRIYLLGHSEGGEEVIAAELQHAHAHGLILLSPMSIPYADALANQVQRGMGSQANVDAMIRANQTFFDSWKTIDPRKEIAHADVPLLAIHGSADENVTAAEFGELVAAAKAAGRSIRVVALDGDDHTFSRADASFDPRVIQAIAAWLGSR